MTEEEEKKQKLPEFIVLEDKYWEKETYHEAYAEVEKEQKEDLASTLKLKAICLLLGSAAFFWTVGTLILSLFTGIVSLLFFRKVLFLNHQTSLYWNWCKGGAAVTLGFYVALFSLFLGIVIIISYFSRINAEWQKMLLAKLLSPHFQKYM